MTLQYEGGTPTVSVRIYDMQNVQTEAMLDVDWNWHDMILNDNSFASHYQTLPRRAPYESMMQGGFYGPNHEEVGGTWHLRHTTRIRGLRESVRYIGAFGAKREP